MKSADQATRCPACKTVFRVVADQLRVSEGWVRCGRCSNVFNAAENIMDMDGGWARLSDEPLDEPRGVEHHSARDVSGDVSGALGQDLARAEAQAESWRLPPTQSHRARQDGHDTERLASKIEAAMSRAQQTRQTQAAEHLQQPHPREDLPQPFQPDESDADARTAPIAAEAAPAAASGLTFRRAPAAPAFSRSTAQGTAPHLAPRESAATANDWPSVPAAPAAPIETVAPPNYEFPAGRAEGPTGLPAPRQPGAATESSFFDETRPESSWPVSPAQAAPGLDGLRAEPRPAATRAPSAKPGFMRKAERDQQWRRPHMRALLAGALAGSALLLLAQVTMAYRDLVAARFPATKPALESLCAALGCTVQAARAINSLTVESSGLVRVDKTPLYKLQVTLRNRAQLDVALPALDVTFTDSKGDVISRKVLLPQDLSSTIDKQLVGQGGTVAGGREVTLQGTLQTNSAAPETVAGYTVELFYP